ncbi:hypothetical protein HAX54_000276, partial [Datura stramonium]|nr:hypothetical protein [Datura stramonium]
MVYTFNHTLRTQFFGFLKVATGIGWTVLQTDDPSVASSIEQFSALTSFFFHCLGILKHNTIRSFKKKGYDTTISIWNFREKNKSYIPVYIFRTDIPSPGEPCNRAAGADRGSDRQLQRKLLFNREL